MWVVIAVVMVMGEKIGDAGGLFVCPCREVLIRKVARAGGREE